MTFTQLCTSILEVIETSPEGTLAATAKKSGTRANLLRRAFHRYHKAQDCRYAREMGLVGVGLITFAERRVSVFIARVERRFRIRTGGLSL